MNRDSVLRLEELDARLVGTETAEVLTDVGVTRANGVFLIATLEITNNLNSPVAFDEFQDQVVFTVGRGGRLDQYTEDFDAENGGDESSFTWQGEEIQPGTTQTGTVIFDMAPEAVEGADKTGGIYILNFSDAGDFRSPKLPVGVIRTYPPVS